LWTVVSLKFRLRPRQVTDQVGQYDLNLAGCLQNHAFIYDAAERMVARLGSVRWMRTHSTTPGPGPVVTPQVAVQPPKAIARIVSTIPMGRMAVAEELVTGIELFADGGRAQV
jgi:hypothetical protein